MKHPSSIDEEEADRGHDARMTDKPFREDASDAWKLGWKEADRELSGEEIEF